MKKVNGKRVLMLASVASMIDQFNMANIRILLEMGYEVHVACNFMEGNTSDETRIKRFRQELQKMNVVYHQWDCPRSAYAVLKCLKAFVQLWKLTERYYFVWFHCHSPVGAALARMVAYKRKIKIIYTAHGFHFYKGASFKNWLLYYPVEKLFSYWTDVLITVNIEDYQFARRHLSAKRIYHIPGIGIDISKFKKYKDAACITEKRTRKKFCQKYSIPENAVVVLSVGELSRRKNHQAVITALSWLQRQDIYYLICGQGEQEGRLKSQAQALGVWQRMRMAGFQADMEEFYYNTDIFVLPSLQEGLSVALMEAMAAGNACVVSDIRGNRELIDDRGGMRFPSGKLRTLAAALDKLADDENLRQACGSYNQQKIKAYSQDITVHRMKKIYAQMEAEQGKEC